MNLHLRRGIWERTAPLPQPVTTETGHLSHARGCDMVEIRVTIEAQDGIPYLIPVWLFTFNGGGRSLLMGLGSQYWYGLN